MVRFLLAALAAFLMLRFAAADCFLLAILPSSLEELDCALVRLGLFHRGERAEIASFSGFGILLSRIKAIFAGFKFADHIR